MLKAIVALGARGEMGLGNGLPWSVPGDLRYFKEKTYGCTVVMGRNTYESIGKPLPGRVNVILTRKHDYFAPGCITINHPEDIFTSLLVRRHIYVIGGLQVYKAYMDYVDELFITRINHVFEADTFWDIPLKQFVLAGTNPRSDANYSYSFETHRRL